MLRPLGKGGQGKTLLVEAEDDPGSRYVLKRLRLEHVDDWKQVELFEREVATLAALDHPGIPRLVDRVIEDGRIAGIVQTYISGRTVAERIAEPEPLPPARFEQVLRQGLEILADLHERVPPVLHRDVSPRNLLLDDTSTYLVDFGAVRVGSASDMTSVGTFGYMAPEQIIGRPEPASDLYGLGMTLVSLAERRDVGELEVDPSTGRVDPSELLRGVDPRVRGVLLGMIEPGLGERIHSAREALRRLDTPAPVVRETGAVEASPEPPLRRGGAGLLFAGVTAAVVAAGGYLAFVQQRPPAERAPAPPAPATEHAHHPPLPAPPPAATERSAPPERPAPPGAAPVPSSPIEVDAPGSAKLRLVSEPPGAKASVDGLETCTTPCDTDVSFGEHVVVFELDGQKVDRKLVVLEDTELRLTVSR